MYTLRAQLFQTTAKRLSAMRRSPIWSHFADLTWNNNATLLKASRHSRDDPNRLASVSLRLKFVWLSKRVRQQKEQNRSQHQREHRSMY